MISTSPHFIDLPKFEGRQPIIGICAMDSKARSKAMSSILNRLIATQRYKVVFFGEKTILDEDIEKWPLCDFLISFFSNGFPLEKALQYTRLRKPFSINSLVRQFLLFDRRVVLEMLKHTGVPIPFHLAVSRDGGPVIHPLLKRVVEQRMGFTLGTANLVDDVEEIDEDTLRVGSQTIRKPFVEKPVDAEDHNIHIYYSAAQGGGVRKLFRKIGNKSSEFYPGPCSIRKQGSYIYEEFIDVENAVDVKVYTMGRDFVHAETRKSPVVDGHVRRNSDGKEIRFVTRLSAEEREYANRVSEAFGQRVCGFDILRASGGRSLVMDVNGWSFVKGNEVYYDEAARFLDSRFQEALRHRWFARFVDPEAVGKLTYESRWVLKGVLTVCRHADRTPKQKIKSMLSSKPIMDFLEGSKSEVVFRQRSQLERILEALRQVSRQESNTNVSQLIGVLERKIDMPGTKVQLKPQKTKTPGAPQVQFILKWGGECTHAGTVQSQDLGETMRKDLMLLNKQLLDNVAVFTSAERRVQSTLATYVSAFTGLEDVSDLVTVRADMLDDNAQAKDEMELAREQLNDFFNYTGPLSENPHYDPVNMKYPKEMGTHPRDYLQNMCDIMCQLIAKMEANFTNNSSDFVNGLQKEWCCNETADLFRERWRKILDDFRIITKDGSVMFNPSKACTLYDSLKYDALHNRQFLERIFMSPDELARQVDDFKTCKDEDACESLIEEKQEDDMVDAVDGRFGVQDGGDAASEVADDFMEVSPDIGLVDTAKTPTVLTIDQPSNTSSTFASNKPTTSTHSAPPTYPPDLLFTQQKVRQLYYIAKQIFDYVTQLEFGITTQQRRKISIPASVPLLKQLINDLKSIPQSPTARTRFYFTKESHMRTLLNLVFLCGMPTMVPYEKVGELDYLTHIIFEVYERNQDVDANVESEYSLRVGFSPGANCLHLLDVDIDKSHALKVLPRRNFTHHMPLDDAIESLQMLLNDSVNVSGSESSGGEK